LSYETHSSTSKNLLGVFTSTGVTGYEGIRVTFLHLNTLQKVTLIPLDPVTPVLVNTPIIFLNPSTVKKHLKLFSSLFNYD